MDHEVNIEFVVPIVAAESEGSVVAGDDFAFAGALESFSGHRRSSEHAGLRVGKEDLDVIGGAATDEALELVTAHGYSRD